jgi:hypothetical protein
MQTTINRRRQYGSAAFVASFACCFAALTVVFIGRSPLFNAVLAWLCGVGLELLRRAKISQLEQKLQVASRTRMDTIYVNGVRAGEISEADYIAVKLDALMQPGIYARQFATVAKFLGKIMAATAILVPVGLFWCLVLGMYFAPEATSANLGPIYLMITQAKNPAELLYLLTSLGELILNVTTMFAFVTAATLVFYGLADGVCSSCFRETIHQRLRKIANCTATGHVYVDPTKVTTEQHSAFVDRTRVLR